MTVRKVGKNHMESTIKYQLICRKATDPKKWIIRAVCSEKWQAEKFISILETASDIYLELKIIPVTIETEGK